MSKKPINVIYRDCEGNIRFNQDLKEGHLEKLKKFLSEFFSDIEVMDFEESITKKRPFGPLIRYKKKISHDIKWDNEDVIYERMNSDKNIKEMVKDLIKISGGNPDVSEQTPFAIIAKTHDLMGEYKKYKYENKIVEKPDNRKKIYKEFAKYYANLEKKRKQKRLQVGTRVYDKDFNQYGTVEEYNESNSKYTLRYDDGSISAHIKRKSIRVG